MFYIIALLGIKSFKYKLCLFVFMKYRVVIEEDEDGMFAAECPALPGCISQGKTRQEALKNIKDAIKGYLESLANHNELSLFKQNIYIS